MKRLPRATHNEEDGKSQIVLNTLEFQISRHACDTSIPYIGTIQEGQQVKNAKPWNQLEIDPSNELLVDGSAFGGREMRIWIWGCRICCLLMNYVFLLDIIGIAAIWSRDHFPFVFLRQRGIYVCECEQRETRKVDK